LDTPIRRERFRSIMENGRRLRERYRDVFSFFRVFRVRLTGDFAEAKNPLPETIYLEKTLKNIYLASVGSFVRIVARSFNGARDDFERDTSQFRWSLRPTLLALFS